MGKKRSGFVAVLGAPNAGKSTLVNRLVGDKVSIVSQKAQTTRTRVIGILTQGAAQAVLIDTPGIFSPKGRLDKAMVRAAWQSLDDADAVLLIVDAAARQPDAKTEAIIGELKRQKRRAVLVLNKTDKISHAKLLPLAARLNEFPISPQARHPGVSRDPSPGINASNQGANKGIELGTTRERIGPEMDPDFCRDDAPGKRFGLDENDAQGGLFEATFMIAALTGDGVEDLKKYVVGKIPEGPWHFPEDQLTDLPERLWAAEITREQIFLQLHEELPYAAAVLPETWEERKDGSVAVYQTIVVTRPNHRAIVLGKNGAQIKKIGEAARKELARSLGRRVHLFLNVKADERWQDKPEFYRVFGLEVR